MLEVEHFICALRSGNSLKTEAEPPRSLPGHLWGLRPTIRLVSSSAADLLIISALALRGIAMAPSPLTVLAAELGAAVVFGLILDVVKIPVFARLHLD
jgi:hypothetical protein